MNVTLIIRSQVFLNEEGWHVHVAASRNVVTQTEPTITSLPITCCSICRRFPKVRRKNASLLWDICIGQKVLGMRAAAAR